MPGTGPLTRWHPPPGVLDLAPDHVDVWRIHLDRPPATVKGAESALSVDEARRAARFRFPQDRDRYILSHGGLRDILARYLARDPGQLHFSANQYGKPALDGRPLEFNLSHSGDLALVAVNHNRQVGVDVERIRPELEFERIAGRFFSQNEVAELMSLPPAERQNGFFTCWTRKEAYIKAQGLGFSLPLDCFDVSLDEPALLRATRPDPEEAARWTLLSLDVGPGHVGAVAVQTSVSDRKGRAGPEGNVTQNVSSELAEGLPEEKELEFRFWDWGSQARGASQREWRE